MGKVRQAFRLGQMTSLPPELFGNMLIKLTETCMGYRSRKVRGSSRKPLDNVGFADLFTEALRKHASSRKHCCRYVTNLARTPSAGANRNAQTSHMRP